MSGTQLIIIAPVILAGIAIVSRRWHRASIVVAFIGLLVLWILLASVSFGGTRGIITGDDWIVAGRTLAMTEPIRNVLLTIMAGMGILILLSAVIPQSSIFVALCLALISPMAASLMARPFSYGAVILIMTAAGTAILIQDERAGSTLASWRHLAYFVLAMPLLLIAIWMLESGQPQFRFEISILLGLAASILLIGFPFHFWTAPTASESRPLIHVAAFGLIQLAAVFFISSLIRSNLTLFLTPQFSYFVRSAGIISVIAGSVLAITSGSLGRLVSYILLFDSGVTLYAIGLGDISGLNLAIITVLLRSISIFLIAIGFGQLRRQDRQLKKQSSTVDSNTLGYRGYAYREPLTMVLLFFGLFSLIGFPMTAGFIGRWAVLLEGSQQSLTQVLVIVISMILCLGAVIRCCIRFISAAREPEPKERDVRSLSAIVTSLSLIFGLILAFFPFWLDTVAAAISLP